MAANAQATPAPPLNVQRGNYLWVLHEHTPRGDDELRMKRGDVILLEEMDEEFQDGWWLGEHPGTGQKGLFPAGFTRKAQAHEVPTSYRLPSSLEHIQTDPAPQGVIASENTESPTQMEPSTPVETSFNPIGSEQTTPQASRHASTSEVLGSPQQQRSASSPLPRPSLAANIQDAFRRSFDSHANGEDSPVMNETLSVIDEHITDMNTPRHSMSTQEAKTINDSGSEYSSHLSHRISYINGNETDEEENTHPSVEEVRRWNPSETAKHLRELGVDPSHCDIFEREEITGDVLLEMDQDTIFMKHFDLGVMGKRLKTWHKIKAFQEEVKGIMPQVQPTRGSISSFAGPSVPEERSLSRAGHTGPFLPRIPTVSERTGSTYVPRISTVPGQQHVPGQHPRLASNGSSPMTPMTPQFGNDSPRRVSAASIRDYNRRHSSIDATNRGLPEFGMNGSHQKKPSFDRGWTLNNGHQPLPARPGTSIGTTTAYRGPQVTGSEPNTPEQYEDLERGYFSGTEVESRRSRRLLQKRTSTGGSISHSRKSSYAEEPYRVRSAGQRQSRIGSVDSMRDAAAHVSPAAQAYHKTPPKSRFRSMSTRASNSQSSNTDGKTGFFSSFGPLIRSKNESRGENKSEVKDGKADGKAESNVRSSTMPFQLPKMGGAGPKIRRAVGLRTISDVVGKGGSDNSAPVSPRDYDPITGRTGSTTPSATSKSSERHSTDGSGKTADGPGFVVRPRTVKSKKDTSAYTRGLEKKSPREQMDGCDYSGWMKKRSSNLMTTWKPRLFVLRGRRLSYYYSEDDTEERGLIDITAHRVLRADNDPIVAPHATVTGATALPANATATENAGGMKVTSPAVIASLTGKDNGGPFFFKLVPPKSNNSRTVQFTRPTTHFFQVDSVQEGRLWMAALMKATIERDLSGKVETSNKQKTISLKQARLMQARPPALMNPPTSSEQPGQLLEEDEEDKGLRIEGLNLAKSPSSDGNSYTETGNEAPENEPEGAQRPQSNPLGDIEVGSSPLLLDSVTKTESK
ncbi:putative polarized growth protein Boi2 [Penicillium brasilianum]|uniref:Putative polarized growth protein Boi2 n=1 Tax=Penicillium brasilianum TaxID=104259 RepID=A0A1S9RC39_PENBI|nr:putative polarized growth protein Boi2 [Penicillium brasilianum]